MLSDKLKYEDLVIGKKVEIDQLSEIYDTMILVGSDKMGQTCGEIMFIGEKNSKNSNDPRAVAAFHSGRVISPIYHDSTELEEDLYYDE